METIIKYFVTYLNKQSSNKHTTQHQGRASRLLMPAFENKEREQRAEHANF